MNIVVKNIHVHLYSSEISLKLLTEQASGPKRVKYLGVHLVSYKILKFDVNPLKRAFYHSMQLVIQFLCTVHVLMKLLC